MDVVRLSLGLVLIAGAGAVAVVRFAIRKKPAPPPPAPERTTGGGPVVTRRTGSHAVVEPPPSPLWIVAIALPLLGGLALVATGIGGGTRWERATSWEGAFSAEWPGTVRAQDARVELPGFGAVSVRKELVEHPAGRFEVDWVDLWGMADPSAALDGARALLPADPKSEAPAELAGQDAGRQYSLGACAARAHAVKKRLFVLTACPKGGREKVARRFFDSFKVEAQLLSARPTPTPRPTVDAAAARTNAERYLTLVRTGRVNDAWMYLPEAARAKISKNAHAAYWKKAGLPATSPVLKVVADGSDALVTARVGKGTVTLRATGKAADPGIVPDALR